MPTYRAIPTFAFYNTEDYLIKRKVCEFVGPSCESVIKTKCNRLFGQWREARVYPESNFPKSERDKNNCFEPRSRILYKI